MAVRCCALSPANQPAAVSVSCVLVYTTELRRWFSSRCGLRRRRRNAHRSTTIPGRPSSSRSAVDRRRDVPEILGDHRQPAELALDRAEELGSRARPPAPALRRRVPRRNRPVGDVAAEVVDAAEVDELERAPKALAPPAVAGRAVDGPVVQRVPPALAGRAERVGRRPGDLAVREQLRPASEIGALVGHVDREVADQPDRRARPRTPAALPTPARSAPGRRAPPRPAKRAQPPVQYGWRATKSSISPAVTRALGPGEELRRGRERRRRAVRRVEFVGRPERQNLPPRLACRGEPVDEPVGVAVELSGRERGRMEEDAGRARELHVLILPHRVRLRACRSPRRPLRGSRSRRSRRRSTAAATRSSAPSATRVEVTARIFRDGHETLGAAVRHKRPDATRWSETPLEPLGNDVWAGSFEVDRPGLWSFRIEAWVDRVASFQEELRRKVAAGQADLAGELSEGAVLLGAEELTVEKALAAPAGARSEKAWSATYSVDVDRVLARFGSWYELFPRSWGGFAGVRKQLPRFAELGFDVLYLPPIHPIGRTNRKGRNNAETAGSRRRRQPVGDRLGGGRPRRDRPVARNREGVPRTRRRREGARDRDRARLRDPVLARPPVAEAASRVVLPPPRRDAEVRREPAEALPGHLQRRLRERGLARALAGAARRRPPLGRLRRHRLPRRQPAHEAACRSGSG